jgi:hypothetical protein
MTYPSGLPVDPLDNPCNWNTLSPGETVAIPLYVREPGNPDKIIINTPETLTLRVRFKCENSADTICDPEDRLVIWEEGVDMGAEDTDKSSRILNWVIESGDKTFTPGIAWKAEDSYRFPTDNFEITINRLLFDFEKNVSDVFYFKSSENTSYVNLLTSEITNLMNAYDDGVSLSDLIDFFGSIGIAERFLHQSISIPSDDNYSGSERAGFYGPKLILEFIDGVYRTQDGSNINSMEYQLVSDVPIGNDTFVAAGYALTRNGRYVLDTEALRAKKPSPPGLVFSN